MRNIYLHCLIVLLALATGKSNADYQQGFAAFSIGDYETALAEWTPLAERGHAESQFGMGQLCANGWGTAQNDAEALKWYVLAATQGHGEAQFNIGVMYQNGWGVDQSDTEALRWMEASAESGFPAAHRTLGGIYESGIGVETDYVQAYQWYETGAMLGDSESNYNREELAMNMDEAEVSAAQALAENWLSEFRGRHPDYDFPDN
jgi:TPR repeat protein